MSEREQLTPLQARRLWVEALRSGEYEQGDGRWLRDGVGRSVLGVACDLYALHTERGRWTNNGYRDRFVAERNAHAFVCFLPCEVVEWLGLASDNGRMDNGEYLYDTELSFSAIADLIESNPPGLFVEEET